MKSQEDIIAGFQRVQQEMTRIETKKEAFANLYKEIATLRAGLQTVASESDSWWRKMLVGPPNALATIEKIQQDFINVGNSATISADQLKKLKDEVEALEKSTGMHDAGVRLFVGETFAPELEKLIAMKKLQEDKNKQLPEQRADSERLKQLHQTLDNSPGGAKLGNAEVTNYAVRSLESLAGATDKLSTKFENLAAGVINRPAAPVVQPQPSGMIEEPHCFGGYYAAGGEPRGVDTIPTMVQKGEYLVNAHSARKFGAQLEAMNAGVKPNYHAHGGSVTNVGDINVNVTGGSTPFGTGREIASSIRRELRRGSATLSQ